MGGIRINEMITADAFIREAEKIYASNPRYRTGGSGTDGTCDCVGLIIGAIRKSGGQWRGLHGSNYAVRKEMRSLEAIGKISELRRGEVVYKAYEPGVGGYNLPKRYLRGGEYFNGDRRDYYHIGIVTSVNPLLILHMTSPRGRIDKEIGKWGWHGELKKVKAEGDESTDSAKEKGASTAGEVRKVWAKRGSTVYLRPRKSTKANYLTRIPIGEEVTVYSDDGTWSQVGWHGWSGFMMSEFLKGE